MNQEVETNKFLDNSWYGFIETSHANPGKTDGLSKTHGCGTAI